MSYSVNSKSTYNIHSPVNCMPKRLIEGMDINDHPIYNIWCLMKQRCYNQKHPHYEKYGGRGITVCERWFNSFLNFLNDMGERPIGRYTLERINNNGIYEPDNCKWATQREQNLNRRPYSKKS